MFNKETSKEVKTFGKETQGKRDFSQRKDKFFGSKTFGKETSNKENLNKLQDRFVESKVLNKRAQSKRNFSQLKDKFSGSNIFSEELFKEDSNSLGNETPKKKVKTLSEKAEAFKESKSLGNETPKKKAKILDKETFQESNSLGNETSKKKTEILGKETFQESNLLAKRTPKKKTKKLDRKEFLSIRFQRFRLQTIEDRLNEIRTTISLAKPNMSDMPGVPRDSMKSDLSAKMTELLNISAQYSNMLVAWNLKVTKLEKQIEHSPIGIYKILHYRYFVGLSWEKIAKLTNYNVGYCMNINSKFFLKIKHKSR